MQMMLSMSWMEKSFAVRGELPHLMRCFEPTRFVSYAYELWFVSSTVKAHCRLSSSNEECVKAYRCLVSPFLFVSPGLLLSMQEHALGVEAEGGTLTALAAAGHAVTGGVYCTGLALSAITALGLSDLGT